MKVLVTGFEPFGGAALNPSQEVLALLKAPSGVELTTAVLPVSFSRAAALLDQKIDAVRPDVLLMLGQAEGRSEISFERVAINLADVSIADNDGEVVQDRIIAPDGPVAFMSTLPVKEMVAAAKSAGAPAGLSLSAGTFLCNFVFYHGLYKFRGDRVRSGFVHLPLMTEQAEAFPGKPTVELSVIAAGINAALTVL